MTEKKGIPLSVVISSAASTHDIKLVTERVDNTVIKRPRSSLRSKPKSRIRNSKRRKLQHLCLDKEYEPKEEEQKLIRQGYILYIPIKKKKKKKGEDSEEKMCDKPIPNRKKYSPKRWVVERTNS